MGTEVIKIGLLGRSLPHRAWRDGRSMWSFLLVFRGGGGVSPLKVPHSSSSLDSAGAEAALWMDWGVTDGGLLVFAALAWHQLLPWAPWWRRPWGWWRWEQLLVTVTETPQKLMAQRDKMKINSPWHMFCALCVPGAVADTAVWLQSF